MNMLEEIRASGGGLRSYFSSFDGFAARTVAYTTARVWGFLYFYDWLNPDPRRTARLDWMIMAGCAGGFVAGVVSNPIEIVFTRMQADAMYPEGARRNYKNILDGLMKCTDEGTLLRGSIANGFRMAAICASMTNAYDWMKENSYYYLGPSWINRFLATGTAVGCGVLFSMPFDAVRVRMHTMRPLPTGELPYKSSWDCFWKMLQYEGNPRVNSNAGCYYAGGQVYAARLFLIAMASQYLLDYYHGRQMTSEFWTPARFNYQGGLDYDIHEPFTDAFNKHMVSMWGINYGDKAWSPD